MSSEGLAIMRLILAAVNGALLAFGIFLLVEFLYRQPKRLRLYLRKLIEQAEKIEVSQNPDIIQPKPVELQKIREEIERVETTLRGRRQHPRFLVNVTFGALMVVIAILSLLNLLFPSWLPFA